MFKDDYKECNQSIKPDKVLVDNIIRRKSDYKLKKTNKSRISPLRRVAAIAAAVLIVISTSALVRDLAINDNFVTEVKDYDQVYSLIKAMSQKSIRDYIQDDILSPISQGSNAEKNYDQAPAAQGDSKSGSPNNSNYSGTNLQVVGVDEADIIKTDGKYIYAVSMEIYI